MHLQPWYLPMHHGSKHVCQWPVVIGFSVTKMTSVLDARARRRMIKLAETGPVAPYHAVHNVNASDSAYGCFLPFAAQFKDWRKGWSVQ